MDLESVLRDTFGLPGFRPGQREVVESVLEGRPTVAVMPTGAGKSLCYQLPAVMAGGTALVVSPLIALMKDQVDSLTARGIPAAAITSASSASERAARLDDLAAGKLRLVYVAPERFRSSRFDERLEAIAPHLSLLAIDEAHCISEWGHDFRPDYRRLGEVVARWKPPRVVALTATATAEVRRDIVAHLGLVDPAVYVRGFDRPNLRFAVQRMTGSAEKLSALLALIRQSPGPSLVYAATRKNAEAYADTLRRANVAAGAYHAGMPDEKRTQVQDRFMFGKLACVVATNAFGMGVDKADVRLVVHADLPRSPEAYYQEAGRGGRDGAPADCVLLFLPSDVRVQEFLIEGSCPSAELLRTLWKVLRDDPSRGGDIRHVRKLLPGAPSDFALQSAIRLLAKAGYLRDDDGALTAMHPGDGGSFAPIDPHALEARAEAERSKLRAMVSYAYGATCRRRQLLGWFGDEDARRIVRCNRCDVCDGGGARELEPEEQAAARAALAMVEQLRGRFGRKRIADLLAGVEGADDHPDRFLEQPGFGALRRLGSKFVLELLRSIEGAGLIVASPGEYPTISITREGRRAIDGGELRLSWPSVAVPRSRRAARAKPVVVRSEAPPDPMLVERLRAYRNHVSAREALPAYCVFSNQTLEAIARARPNDIVSLGMLPGIGPVKLEKYGREIVEIVTGKEAREGA
jgi:ATP-dependent DNA helicase RecQ